MSLIVVEQHKNSTVIYQIGPNEALSVEGNKVFTRRSEPGGQARTFGGDQYTVKIYIDGVLIMSSSKKGKEPATDIK